MGRASKLPEYLTAITFKQSGNLSGRPKGARNLLSVSVLKELINFSEKTSLHRSPIPVIPTQQESHCVKQGLGGGGVLLGREC